MSTDDSGQKYRGEHDPYNGMETPETRPSYIARQSLSDAEKIAGKTQNPSYTNGSHRPSSLAKQFDDSSISGLRSREANQTSSNFRNSVTGRRHGKHSFLKSDGKGSFRKKKRLAPIAFFMSLIFGGGALFYFSQTTLAPTLSSLYTNSTDLQYTSYNARNQRLFKYMMNGGDQMTIGALGKRYTTFSPYLKKRLKNNGISVGYLDSGGNFHDNQLVSDYRTVLKYNDEIIDADAFQNKFASDVNFREAYYKAKRGRVASFFDSSADYYYKKKGATRDIFNRYKSTGDYNTDTANFRETVSNRVTGTDASLNTVNHSTDEETGEERYYKNGDDIATGNISGDSPEAKARTLVNNIAGRVSNVGVPICSALRIANMAAVTVSAYKIYASISYFLSLMEPVSKTLYGSGDASAINETLNFLTADAESEVQYVNSDGTITTKTVTGSPLQSAGAKMVLGNTPSSEAETAPYSIKDVTRAATTIAASTGASNVVCDGVMASSAIMSLVSNSVPGGKLANFIVSAIAHTIGGVAITGVVSLVVSTIIPYVAKIFARNIFDAYQGVPAGEFYSQGSANSNFKLATEGSAYMPASEQYVKKQNHETTVALAQEAAVDRNERSPFDITSRNTFLGSLLSKFAFLSYTNNGFSILSNFATTIKNAFNVFNPVSSAYDGGTTYTSNYHYCEDALGNTVCDMYDQEIVAMDYSTIDLAPDDPTYLSVITPNLDNDGNIKKNSELAKFITVCTERESPWGVLDANVMNALQTDFGTVGNNLFLINDAVDIINAAEDYANRDWGTGENCKMSSNNPRWDSEFKYYQRYIEDMRILSGMSGEKDSNPVLAYQKQYDEEHPIDTSFEGTLARISGQSKEDIAFLLEYTRYSEKIANYDPSERYSFTKTTEPTTYNFSSESDFSTTYATLIQTNHIFVDRRNYIV